MKIRIKFRKYGALKFVGHLDMMRYFQKALKRAGIDMKYSEGFNPHMIMSFAAPLGVRITSDGEYFDIEVLSTKSTEESLKVLNEAMVEGVEVTSYVALPDTAKKSMSLVAAADYEIFYKKGYEIPKIGCRIYGDLSEFLRRTVRNPDRQKRQKKSEREMDLKPLIYDFQVQNRNDTPVFYLKVCTGSVDNIKPELVLASMFAAAGLTYHPEAMQIHKLETYTKNEQGDFIPLDALGENIV